MESCAIPRWSRATTRPSLVRRSVSTGWSVRSSLWFEELVELPSNLKFSCYRLTRTVFFAVQSPRRADIRIALDHDQISGDAALPQLMVIFKRLGNCAIAELAVPHAICIPLLAMS